MKPALNLFSLLVLLLPLNSCQPTSDVLDQPVQLGSGFTASFLEEVPESVAIIYDYNPVRAKLESKAVKVKPSTGDKLKDALSAFFATNKLYGSYDHISLKEIDKQETPNTLIFSGRPGFTSEDDKIFFTMALEMTIARNYESMNYKVKFVDF